MSSRAEVKAQTVKTMTGKNVTPPSLGMGRLWTLRASGTSKSRLRNDMIRILGMMMRPNMMAVIKLAAMISIFSIIWFSV